MLMVTFNVSSTALHAMLIFDVLSAALVGVYFTQWLLFSLEYGTLVEIAYYIHNMGNNNNIKYLRYNVYLMCQGKDFVQQETSHA